MIDYVIIAAAVMAPVLCALGLATLMVRGEARRRLLCCSGCKVTWDEEISPGSCQCESADGEGVEHLWSEA